MRRSTFISLLIGAGIVMILVGTSYLARIYEPVLRATIGQAGMWGMFVYVSVTVAAVVCAPISTLPLVSVAATLWGWVYAAVLSIMGWIIGAQIAFVLARRFGVPLVARLVPLERIRAFEHTIPRERVFWTVVLLRTTLPVDLLSYALGLFSTMSSSSYFFATCLGVIPFGFVFTYAGTLPVRLQVVVACGFLLVFGILYVVRTRRLEPMS